MPASFAMPQNWEQDTVALLPDLTWAKMNFGNDPLLSILPVSFTEASKVLWDQYQNPYGLIPLRGVDAKPDLVELPGLKTYEADPGFYGMATLLKESEMLFARQPNTPNDPIDTAKRLEKMLLDCSVLIVNRFRQMAGSLLATGIINNYNASGELTHAYKVDDFQLFSPANDSNTGPGWTADPTNADPIGDLIFWQRAKLERGTDAKFSGAGSKIKINPTGIIDFWRTTSVREKFRSAYGASYLPSPDKVPGLEGSQSVNGLMVGAGLPEFEVVGDGYYATEAAAIAQNPDDFIYAIPDGSLIWAGVRPGGQPIGGLKLTRHAGVGAYQADKYPSVSVPNESLVDLAKGIYINVHFHNRQPHHYEIEMGLNCAPVIYYRRGLAAVSYN